MEIVDHSVHEDQQQAFVDTTGLNDVSVERVDDPQRIELIVDHAA